MFGNKRILGLIPARGGSKGIPRKNIIDLCGRPLISYTIEAGKKSKYIDYLMVSTDDIEIANISKQEGAEVPFLRPAIFAEDTSKTIDAVLHAIKMLKQNDKIFDTLVLLQPTQPLRTAVDIDMAIEEYMISGCKPLASVNLVDDHPLLIRSISQNKLVPLLNLPSTCRRQDMPSYYRINGCIYINEINLLNESTSFNDNYHPFVMENSHSVDIDELKDLSLAAFFLNKKEPLASLSDIKRK